MAGAKPSRSDEILDADQQLLIAEQVRAQFESLAPRRPAKPNRSESDSTAPLISPSPDADLAVPELDKLKYLQTQPQSHVISSLSIHEVPEEFVETEYYKKLESIDKQHHTTGSGFIKVAADMDDYDLQLAGGEVSMEKKDAAFKSNPATNDWIPSPEGNQVAHISSKPSRSEGS